jgi:hypothetical protein
LEDGGDDSRDSCFERRREKGNIMMSDMEEEGRKDYVPTTVQSGRGRGRKISEIH